MDLTAKNKRGETVYPYIKGKPNTTSRGFDITLTGNKADYFLVSLETLLEHIRAGDFDQKGRIRMKSLSGGDGNGFAIRKAFFSDALKAEIASASALV
jgi:hypothetical protein